MPGSIFESNCDCDIDQVLLRKGTSRVEFTAWSKDLRVTGDGSGVASHAGLVLLRLLADRVGLTQALSAALTRRRFWPVHDRGRVLTEPVLHVLPQHVVRGQLGHLRPASPPVRMPLRGRGPVIQVAAAGRRVAAQLP
jgi:hypothetical protein